MAPSRIVPTLDELEDGHSGFGMRPEPPAIKQFAFEALGSRLLLTVRPSALTVRPSAPASVPEPPAAPSGLRPVRGSLLPAIAPNIVERLIAGSKSPEFPSPRAHGTDRRGPRTFQGTPMRHRGVHVGNFYLVEKEGGGAFTDEDEEILVLFASQAATAIVNARTYRAEQRARADLEALIETSPVGVVVFDVGTGRPVSLTRRRLCSRAPWRRCRTPDTRSIFNAD